MDQTQDRVGFLGLGIMGEPMALRLVRAGVPLVVWNRSPRAVETLACAGAEAADSVADVFQHSRIVILMLAGTDAIDAVLGHAGHRRPEFFAGKTIINMGTVPPAYSQQLDDEIRTAGGVFVEAPVSGSRRPAEEGALVGMLAGPERALDEVPPIIEHLCASVTYCGEIPAALTMKLSVNVFLIAVVTGLAESFHFAQQHGLSLDALRLLLDAGQMSSPISRLKTEKIVANDWAPQAAIRDVLMNSALITDAARSRGIASPLLDVCRDLYDEAVQRGDGSLDMAAVVRAITDRTASTPIRQEPINKILIRGSREDSDYSTFAEIWRRAVDATHDFLTIGDRNAIEARLCTDYFPSVTLSAAEVGGRTVGFCGTLDGSLEMLFVDPSHHGNGVGTALLRHAIRNDHVTRVDVNEQNTPALRFYEYHGFEIVRRSPSDEAGRPYPLLHLAYKVSR
ncbi:GNAT family N-acetyltransferase [Leucobacter allii]|uniref:GNAT family N-acetyltransferase n=1 Tax=Leucobacter allii TaxID=2932247 RepID=UPI001FD401E2|nr:GNAT family N-acetyltransferase [Leucobacter allii]UOR02451.1 GNAT family N-acetyltransferase [Leucobacter allii]